jgi:uncharacterized protein YndB with AHSA1/START domain
MSKSKFVYVTYIRTTPERLWSALTDDADFMKQYWFGVHCESAWKPGSSWQMLYPDGRVIDSGEIVEADPPRRLVIRWQNQMNPEFKAEGHSLCTMDLEPVDNAVKLTVHHTMDLESSKLIGATSFFWPQILCNLKSLVESGSVVLAQPCSPN